MEIIVHSCECQCRFVSLLLKLISTSALVALILKHIPRAILKKKTFIDTCKYDPCTVDEPLTDCCVTCTICRTMSRMALDIIS